MMEPIARRDWPELLAGFNARIMHLERDRIVREALEFIGGIGGDRASLALLDEGNQRFQLLHVTRGIDTLLEGHFIPLPDTVLSLVVRGDQPLYRPDIRSEQRRFPVDERLIQAGIVCDFLIPLVIEDTCLGTLNCGASSPDGIPASVRGLLVLFAPTLAQALLNARLFESARRSEAEASEAGSRYRDFFETAYVAIFLLDERHRYVDVNRRGIELFGYTREEFVGRSVLEFVQPEQLARSEAAFRELVGKGEYHDFAGRMRTKDGRWLDIEVNSSAITRNGEFVG
jgi:PAS domain S-box-containing protein